MKLFNTYHTQRRALLSKHLVSFIHTQNEKTSDDLSHKALERINDFSTSGKMLRGVFVLLAYEMFGGTIDKNILNVASVMELSQAALLIHDDIMDNDMLRRGKKTIYAQYSEDAAALNLENPEEYGKSMAIVVGDAATFLTYELIGELKVPSEVRSWIMKTYSHEMLKVALGQFMDYHYGKTSENRSFSEIEHMYTLKTGAYTFTLPFSLGAYMARASEVDSKVLGEITNSLGIIFQIKDDELGLFGETELTGKKVGADLEEDKKTLLIALLQERVTKHELKIVNNILGNPVSFTEIKYIRSLMETHGILQELNDKVAKLSNEAKKAINRLTIEPNYKDLFVELVDYNATRDK